MKKMKTKDFMEYVLIIGLIVSLIWVGGSLIYNTTKSCETTVQYVLAGNYSEAPPLTNGTIVTIQYDCIKYCANQRQYPEKCWEQCFLLGK